MLQYRSATKKDLGYAYNAHIINHYTRGGIMQEETKGNVKIMTINDVASFLKLSKITIYKLIKKGELPAFRVGNSWRFHRDKIEMIARPQK